MFDNKRIEVIVPPGPYPEHQCKLGGVGTLVPKVEPAAYYAMDRSYGSPTCGTQVKCLAEGTAVLYWQCTHCGERI